jgi:hypothetical protein
MPNEVAELMASIADSMIDIVPYKVVPNVPLSINYFFGIDSIRNDHCTE